MGVLLAAATTTAAYADDVANTIDASVDAAAEQMSLTAGGVNGSTTLVVAPANGDGKSGCNLTAQTTATFELNTSNAAAATVSPASVTFASCGEVKTVTVTPHAAGSATITLRQTANSSQGTFNVAPATFAVTVSAPVATNTPPVVGVTGFADGASYELGVDTLPTPGCSVQDAEDSGESASPTVTPVLDALGIGTTTATCSYTDRGGLTSSASASYSTADTLAPTIERVSVLPAANGAGWNSSPVTATWACADAGTGVLSETVSGTTAGEGASLSLTGTCTDRAGHSASDTVDGIAVDLTAPAISIGRNPAANAAGWNNGDVTVAWTCTDELSGPTDEGGSTVLGEGADQSASGTCTDLAGNTASGQVSDVDVDKTAPTVSWTAPIADGASFYFGSVPSAPGCTASDQLSGLSGGCSVTGHLTSVGTHTVTATATDVAGNESALRSTYTVRAWTIGGFYKPVDMNGVLNTVKNGSTVPLKFEVFAGSTELTSTSAVAAVFSVKGITCPGASTPTDDVELTTTGGTSFRYDATGGQFVQNWQTPKKAGACYSVSTTTADGSSVSASFQLK
ncbi:hypothetical protein ASG94_00435 [Nocardioides sp. Soil805]|nr:hypothetical protein ASG94_00435 [Nocardioides sp. Soil805]